MYCIRLCTLFALVLTLFGLWIDCIVRGDVGYDPLKTLQQPGDSTDDSTISKAPSRSLLNTRNSRKNQKRRSPKPRQRAIPPPPPPPKKKPKKEAPSPKPKPRQRAIPPPPPPLKKRPKKETPSPKPKLPSPPPPSPSPPPPPSPSPPPPPSPSSPPPPSPSPPPPPLPSSEWTTVWQDDFSGTSVDSNKWSFQESNGAQYDIMGWGNSERQWYTSRSDNVRVENGNLIIEPKDWGEAFVKGEQSVLKDQFPECYNTCKQRCDPRNENPVWLGDCIYECSNGDFGCRFTSTRMRTYKKFSVSPGDGETVRVEARIKLPKGNGLWPALWMLPETGATDDCSGCGSYGGWPSSGEIDILEVANDMNKVITTIHYGGPGGDWRYASNPVKIVEPSAADDWHTYSFEWTTTSMKWFMDGELLGTQYSKGVSDGGWYSTASNAGAHSPFDKDFHIMLNVALGGGFAQSLTDVPLSTGEIAKTLNDLPKEQIRMKVDYIKVQKKTIVETGFQT